jgi:general secretion pathway protein H
MTRACERGFTLLEMVCVIALVAMVAAVLLPFVPRHTSRAGLQAYAIEAASLLKADRNAAIRRSTEVSTRVDASSRAIRSGATAQLIRIPEDVRFETLLPQSCRQRAALSTISFFADGMSCGGAIALTRLDSSYEIRVNWLTGRVEIISHDSRAN